MEQDQINKDFARGYLKGFFDGREAAGEELYAALERERRLRGELEKYKPPQPHICPVCGKKTYDLACCMYDDEEGGGK